MLERGRLVVSRSEGQVLQVGDITLTFRTVRGKTVSVVIEAPKEVPITRPDSKKGPKGNK